MNRVLQARYLVLQLQFASLQLCYRKIIRAWVAESVFDFTLEGLVALLKLGQMRFDGHQRNASC